MIILVAGKSGSGKSTFAKVLAEKLNFKYVDIDKIGHKIYENPSLMEELKILFGNAIFDENGNFDRKRLGKIVFSEKGSKKVEKFNEITWKHMEELIDKELLENTILDWILLPNTKYFELGDLKILVKPENEEVRIQNIIKRDNVSREYVLLRDKGSIPYNEKEFDFVIKNNYNYEKFESEINKVVDHIKKGENVLWK